MLQDINIDEFIHLKNCLPVVDVRSPGEFKNGHIPDAVNLPLFNDIERASIGTVYVKKGRKEAIVTALNTIGPELKNKIDEIIHLNINDKILLYCWRGGMRSSSMAWLVHLLGYEPIVLTGGYKAYRNHMRNCLSRAAKFIVIGGMTGSGKSEILKHLQHLGQQVINLEELACHKGSVFGYLGMMPQPTNEQFENTLFEQWNRFDLDKPIWIEDESSKIGNIQVPQELYNTMLCAPVIEILSTSTERLNRIIKEYGGFNKELLILSIQKIQKHFGGLNTRQTIEAVEKGDLQTAAGKLLNYYDKAYQKTLDKRFSAVFKFSLNHPDMKKNAEEIMAFAQKISFEYSSIELS
jgi:tRNA 2-selenouridine synthase